MGRKCFKFGLTKEKGKSITFDNNLKTYHLAHLVCNVSNLATYQRCFFNIETSVKINNLFNLPSL